MDPASQANTGGQKASDEQSTASGQIASGGTQGPVRLAQRLRRNARQMMDRLTQYNYRAAKAYYRYRLARADRRFRGRPPLLIYTMGKVGSSSMLYSLKLLQLNRQLHHLHSLARKPLRKLEESLKPSFPDNLVSFRHIWRCQHVANTLAQKQGDQIQAISLIRDPLARNLSHFFQHIDVEPYASASHGSPSSVRKWKLVSSFLDFETVVSERDTSPLVDLYFDKEWHDFPALWIDRELGGVLGIDVYATEFPRDKGYAVYHSNKADLLLIRLRDLDRCAPQAIQDFLGIAPFTLVNANVAETKEYVDVYRAFKTQITFPKSYLDRTYDSEFVKHFYSDAERQALKAKWATD